MESDHSLRSSFSQPESASIVDSGSEGSNHPSPANSDNNIPHTSKSLRQRPQRFSGTDKKRLGGPSTDTAETGLKSGMWPGILNPESLKGEERVQNYLPRSKFEMVGFIKFMMISGA